MGWTFYDSSGRRLSTVVQDVSNGGNAGALVLGTNDSNSLTLETNNTARMVLAAGGDVTVSTGNVIIGTAGKGIDFAIQTGPADTMTAELLDRYEIGTWSPGIGDNDDTTGTGDSQTYHAQNLGMYARIGRTVFLTGRLKITSTGGLTGTHDAVLTGLPFAPVSAQFSTLACSAGEGLAITAGNTICVMLQAGNAYGNIQTWSETTGTTGTTVTEISGDGHLMFSGSYPTG
jgi:hypothetical protein